MKFRSGARRGFLSGSCVLSIVSLVAACAPRVEEPAPVVSGGTPEWVTIQRGQSLSEIAHSYHVPMRVVAEANGLSPPYRIQAGRTLMIPGVDQPRAPATAAVAALPAAAPENNPPSVSPVPAPPDQAAAPATAALVPTTPAEATPPASEPGPTAAEPAAPLPRGAAEPTASSAATPPGRGNSAFLWPVRGRILATYGSRTDGTHNDGINIGAPRGMAVQAADAGLVAYTGNELRGYGNLILIKHPNGWISAYAHCDQILVKRGEKVARGQVIARVGSTGSVSEPQLHFELRRGQHAVDPREILGPLPTAAAKDSRSG